METNFEIQNNNAVQLNGIHIVLHDDFNFIGFSKKQNNISIDFKKTKGDWVEKEEFNSLNFEFKNVTYEYNEKGDP